MIGGLSVVKTADRVDTEVAAGARIKMAAGESLTVVERAALKRVDRADEEDRRIEYYQTVPKKHYIQMSGRQARVLNDQADRYGFALRGRTVDLFKVIRQVHDFLADNAKILSKERNSSGDDLAETDEYKKERTLYTRVMRLEREGVLIERSLAHDVMVRFSAVIRDAGAALEKSFGSEAQEILNDYIDRADDIVEELDQQKVVNGSD